MPDVALVAAPAQDQLVHELAATIGHELERQGVKVTLHRGRFPAPEAGRVFILINAREYLGLMGPGARPDPGVLRRTIFVGDEPPPEAEDDPHAKLLREAGAVFALDRRCVAALHRLGVPARWLRPGYSDALDHFDPEARRPLDITVLGAHSLRRTRYLRAAAPVLARHNCLIQLTEPGSVPGASASALGAGRWPLLAQTKVVLNLHRDDDDDAFEWRAALDAIHAGAVVVSEHAAGIAPLEVGRHLLVAGPRALPYVADALLRDPARLAALRSEAYERLSTWIPYALPVSVLRAAIVELVGEPLPAVATSPPDGNGERSGPGAGRHPTEADAGPEQPGVGVGSPGREHAAGAVTAQSPAWGARRAPRVSVVCALGHDAGLVDRTLDSVGASRMSDLELIALHAADLPAPGEAAAGWSAQHPRIAARVLAVAGRPGTAALRRAGALLARAPLCLILDAGQEIYPRGLHVLAGTLDAMPDVAFVYPIQAVTGAVEAFVAAGGDYLAGVFAWSPATACAGGAIRTPLLIRTDVWRRVAKGRRSEPFDDADDDLVCAIAESGRQAQLVPQVLAGRREAGPSRLTRE